MSRRAAQQTDVPEPEGTAMPPAGPPLPVWSLVGLALGGAGTLAWSAFLLWGAGHLVGLW
jgi:hypothetical protein